LLLAAFRFCNQLKIPKTRHIKSFFGLLCVPFTSREICASSPYKSVAVCDFDGFFNQLLSERDFAEFAAKFEEISNAEISEEPLCQKGAKGLT